MEKKNALLDAVADKVGKRAPAFKRKGMPDKKPGLAVMIAVGAPKAGMTPPMGKAEGKGEGMSEQMPKAQKIAALQEKIAALKAELALLEDEDEDEMEDEGEEMESEDEDEDED